ncbi:MAG: Major facilitator family transporter [Candidatus Saccharicenans subterraneus]|uniref:Major facilitator family transporter n=1 Tax=Candidatus Saccharicenans subterraneus TaxID=2508984 RepID=A0A3E2BL25_9BACT|nr:MAG: Major facilitator family transporter [Candidatus Saccharicenans subterraneum]
MAEKSTLDRKNRLWSRDFLLGLTAYFFLFLSVSLFFLLPLFLKQFQFSGSQVGLIMGIHSLTAIAIRPFFGSLIDRQGGKKISLLGIAILILSVPLFHLVNGGGTLPVLLRALTGIGWGISMTATITMCTDLAPVQSMARSIGIVGVAGLIANAVGPSLGEEIIRRAGFAGLFNSSLVFLLLSFLLVSLTRELPKEDREPGRSSPLSGILGSASLVVLLIIGSMPVVHGSVRGAMIYFMPLLVKALSLGRVGPFFIIFSAAAIMSRFRLGGLADRFGPKRVVLISAVIIGLNLFLIWQIKSMAGLWLTGFIGGFGQGLIFPALSTYLIYFLGRENKGLAISLYNSLFDVGMGLGSIFYGWISELAGLQPMYLVAGIILLSFTIIFKIKAPDIRRPAWIRTEGG